MRTLLCLILRSRTRKSLLTRLPFQLKNQDMLLPRPPGVDFAVMVHFAQPCFLESLTHRSRAFYLFHRYFNFTTLQSTCSSRKSGLIPQVRQFCWLCENGTVSLDGPVDSDSAGCAGIFSGPFARCRARVFLDQD